MLCWQRRSLSRFSCPDTPAGRLYFSGGAWTGRSQGVRIRGDGSWTRSSTWCTWWHHDGTVERIHGALRRRVRSVERRSAESSVGFDSQSVRTADTLRGSGGHTGASMQAEGQSWQTVPRHRHTRLAPGGPRRSGRSPRTITAHRHLARDYESISAYSETVIRGAMIGGHGSPPGAGWTCQSSWPQTPSPAAVTRQNASTVSL